MKRKINTLTGYIWNKKMGCHMNNGRLSDIIGVYIYICVCFFQKNGYMANININHYSDVGFVDVFLFLFVTTNNHD